MEIEKLSIENLEYIEEYSSNMQIIKHACMSKINEIIDVVNSFKQIHIEYKDGYVEMCKKCNVIPAIFCEKCKQWNKRE